MESRLVNSKSDVMWAFLFTDSIPIQILSFEKKIEIDTKTRGVYVDQVIEKASRYGFKKFEIVGILDHSTPIALVKVDIKVEDMHTTMFHLKNAKTKEEKQMWLKIIQFLAGVHQEHLVVMEEN